MEGIFNTVIKANRDYVKAVDSNANAEVQENLLTTCRILMKTMIQDAGLCNEYKEYCEQHRELFN